MHKKGVVIVKPYERIDTLTKYFLNGLVSYFSVFIVFFFLVGASWVAVDHFEMLDVTMKYSTAFDDLQLIIAIIYGIWIAQSYKGYMDRPTLYRSILNKFYMFMMTFESSEYDVCRMKVLYNSGICIVEGMFHGETVQLDERAFQDFQLEVPIGHDDHDPCCHINCIVYNMKKQAFLSENRLLYAPYLKDIDQSLVDMDIMMNIKHPTLFYNHMALVIMFYLFVIIPYKMTIRMDLGTLVAYPVVMVLLAGPVILKKFQSDPFDKSRPWPVNDIQHWASEFHAK